MRHQKAVTRSSMQIGPFGSRQVHNADQRITGNDLQHFLIDATTACAAFANDPDAGRRAADAVEEPGERELDPLVFETVADALCDVADRTLAAFDVPLEERLAQLQAGELGGGVGCAPSTLLPELGGGVLGMESLTGKTRVLRAAFDAAHIVLDTRATITNAALL